MLTDTKLRNRDVILASASPRRQELMQLITQSFRVIPADCDEGLPGGVDPREAPEILAKRKCDCISEVYKSALVIGCDTVVVCGDELLGKPRDDGDAFRMLRLLSGRKHQVITGVCVYDGSAGSRDSFKVSTDVFFRELSDRDIEEYIATGEPRDKAGAYGIQGYGALLCERIEGDFFNVVGLPVSELAARLKA